MKKKILLISGIILTVVIIASILLIFLKIIPDYNERKALEKQVEIYRANKINQYEEENLQYDDYEVDVAFLGDSLTDGYDVKKYFPQYKVTNRGIGGDTTFDLEKRLKVSAFDLKPKVLVMLIGANNFNTMFDNYEDILISIKNNLPQTKVILLSLTSMGGNHWGKNNQIAAFNNAKIKLFAEKYEYSFVDLFTPLFDLSIGEIKPEYTIDGGHLTPKGYEVLTSVITPVLDELL